MQATSILTDVVWSVRVSGVTVSPADMLEPTEMFGGMQ